MIYDMKVAMSFTLDHTLCVLLKEEDNASNLVNGLLVQHFSTNSPQNKQKIVEYRQKIKEIKQKGAVFDQKEKETYHKLLKEQRRRNTKLTPESETELAYLDKKFGGIDVLEKPTYV